MSTPGVSTAAPRVHAVHPQSHDDGSDDVPSPRFLPVERGPQRLAGASSLVMTASHGGRQSMWSEFFSPGWGWARPWPQSVLRFEAAEEPVRFEP